MKGEARMNERSDEEVLLRDYLLGALDEVRQEQVEERLLRDDDFAERLSEEQDALIDAYVFGALTERERESFDKNFIIDDQRRQKILFAQALEVYIEERYGPQPATRDADNAPLPWWRNLWQFLRAHKAWAGAATVTLLLLLLTPPLLRRFRPPTETALRWERRANIERRVDEVNKRPADQSTQALPASELALQQTRLREDGGLRRAYLTGDIKLLTLQLALPQVRHENCRALVLTVDGKELFAADNLTPEVHAGVAAVRLNLPTEFLATGDYQIRLWGRGAGGSLTEVGRYSFGVIKQT